MKRTSPHIIAIGLAMLALCPAARGDELAVEEWNGSVIVDPAQAYVIIHDSSAEGTPQDPKTKKMKIENFMAAYEEVIADEIAFESKLATGNLEIIQSTAESPVTLSELQLIAPSDGLYLFHAIVEFQGEEDEAPFGAAEPYTYGASVRKGGTLVGGPGHDATFPLNLCYAREERHPASRQRYIPPANTTMTPEPPTKYSLRVINLTGTVWLHAGQYIDLEVWQESGNSVDLVSDSCSPSMYMRRLQP